MQWMLYVKAVLVDLISTVSYIGPLFKAIGIPVLSTGFISEYDCSISVFFVIFQSKYNLTAHSCRAWTRLPNFYALGNLYKYHVMHWKYAWMSDYKSSVVSSILQTFTSSALREKATFNPTIVFHDICSKVFPRSNY